ncbi:MAG: TlpA family protein disulfide reductase [Planctomycetaceae bacterium]|jgi:thiol-disulfide isomerase/thioredoxin|nr:TlpA family protein disulfide reductase [Planctomycetaceae bacterium]
MNLNMTRNFLKQLSAISLFAMVSILLIAPIAVVADEKKVTSIDEADTVLKIITFTQSFLWNVPEETEARKQHSTKLGETWIAGGEKILKIAKDPKEKTEGFQMILGGLHRLIYVDQLNAIEKNIPTESKHRITRDKLVEELKKDEQYAKIVANFEYYSKFASDEADELGTFFSLDKFNKFVERAKELSKVKAGSFKPTDPLLKAVNVALSAAAVAFDPELANKTIKEVTAYMNSDEFITSEEDKKAGLERLEGYALRIVGTSPEIYGKTIDDKDFDWAALRGKYVLVKFTASWCGPCKRELPGMRTAYEKYHDKGLEIVSVYVWDTLVATKKVIEDEKLSWLFISEELTEKAGLKPQGKKFAISGVPTLFLVDKIGKIILTDARGDALQQKLAELFKE